mmetsp:Transcript_4175/g.15006  ORF Transcript_4175/g.15006 Transcript_4175/m.15006 type:complete len:139 (-) Transcript_4175:79-495(-)|eukprot:scaffold336_cov384-Prasinococcus_capsulatus_cf.AAC.31
MAQDEDGDMDMDPPEVDEVLAELDDGGKDDGGLHGLEDLDGMEERRGDIGKIWQSSVASVFNTMADLADIVLLASPMGQRMAGLQPPEVETLSFHSVYAECKRAEEESHREDAACELKPDAEEGSPRQMNACVFVANI